ncbi:MAG: hypothetical protein ABJP45_09610 [Cyclobacteriaceae bacterium]
MRGILIILIWLSTKSLFGQVDEVVLADTVKFISAVVSELKSERMTQEAVRLNFDDCNLEYTQSHTNRRVDFIEFWLADLDEEKMRLEFNEKASEWSLKLVCKEEKRRIQATGSGMISKLYIYSSEKEPLISLGNALFYAIQNCKGLDRFKDR